MGILRDFEHRLERIVEGFFTKAFRSGLQPVELAKRLLREMDAGKTVGLREVWVPNRYVLRLSDEDRQRLAGMEKALGRELERVVVDGARAVCPVHLLVRDGLRSAAASDLDR